MKRIRGLQWMLGLSFLLIGTPAGAAGKAPDVVWTHPDPARLEIGTIAVLPVVVVDGDPQAATMIEKAVPWKWVPTGHAWLTAASCRDMLRRAGGEALLQGLADQVRRDGRVDSVAAQEVARVLHMRAFLAVRVDKWVKHERDRRQLKSKPSYTAIGLRAVLVDSTGTLLWSASGSEIMEEAQAPEGAVADSPWRTRPGAFGMGLSTVTTAPPFEDVLAKLLARWKPLFLAARRST